MEVKYTWYVNCMGDVQIYEGDVNENNIYDYVTIENAELHLENEEAFVDFARSNARESKLELIKKYKTCKYYIAEEFSEMFFTIINSSYYHGASGCTDIELSDFLD